MYAVLWPDLGPHTLGAMEDQTLAESFTSLFAAVKVLVRCGAAQAAHAVRIVAFSLRWDDEWCDVPRRARIRALLADSDVGLLDVLVAAFPGAPLRLREAILQVFWHFGENDDDRRVLLARGAFQLTVACLHEEELYDTAVGGLWGQLEYEALQNHVVPHLSAFVRSFDGDRPRRETVQGLGCVHLCVANPSRLGARALCREEELLDSIVAIAAAPAEPALTNTQYMDRYFAALCVAATLELGAEPGSALAARLEAALGNVLPQLNIAELQRVENEQCFRWVNVGPFEFMLHSSNPLVAQLGVVSFATHLANAYTRVLPSWTAAVDNQLVVLQWSRNAAVCKTVRELVPQLCKLRGVSAVPSLECTVRFALTSRHDRK